MTPRRTPRSFAAFPLPALALLALALVVGRATPLRAQGVLVAPQAVFMDHRTRAGAIELYNPGTEPAEVSISTLFGYPVTDSSGVTTLYTSAAPDPDAPSAAGWVQAFPRRLKLAPGQRQTVRLMARPPQNLPDGEYWTRLVIEASGGRVDVGGADSTSIQVGLLLKVRTVIALLYRKGGVSTGVALSNLRANVVGDSVAVRMRLAREGNAAYLGQVHAALLDARGREARSFAAPMAVYYALEPRYSLPVAGLAPGRYTLALRVDTSRDDITTAGVLAGRAVRDTVSVVVPPRR
jgi:P pilus assembly chaperone PapD